MISIFFQALSFLLCLLLKLVEHAVFSFVSFRSAVTQENEILSFPSPPTAMQYSMMRLIIVTVVQYRMEKVALLKMIIHNRIESNR